MFHVFPVQVGIFFMVKSKQHKEIKPSGISWLSIMVPEIKEIKYFFTGRDDDVILYMNTTYYVRIASNFFFF
jgi:hypothetical protein